MCHKVKKGYPLSGDSHRKCSSPSSGQAIPWSLVLSSAKQGKHRPHSRQVRHTGQQALVEVGQCSATHPTLDNGGALTKGGALTFTSHSHSKRNGHHQL